MTAKYRALLTDQGKALLANAAATGQKLEITQMAVGDGGGTATIPSESQTELVGEKRRAALNSLQVNTNSNNQVIAEQVIPEDAGGWWIRELGLYDKNGVLVAIANTPDTYKPLLVEGAGRTQVVRMVLLVKGDASAMIVADKTAVLVSRDTLDAAIAEHARSRNHPDATLLAKGFIQLSNDSNSNSESLAATPKAVKAVNDEVKKRLPLSGGDITGLVRMSYKTGIYGLDAAGVQTNMVMLGNQTYPNAVLLGGSNIPSIIISQTNPQTLVAGKPYTFYHTGNKPTAADVGAYSKVESEGRFVQKNGDTITGELSGQYNGSQLLSEQHKSKAAFFDEFTTTSENSYSPLIKQKITIGNQSAWALSQGGFSLDGIPKWLMHFRGSAGQDIQYSWSTEGDFVAPRNLKAGNALFVGTATMVADGNIWGTRWNANGQWLWDAVVSNINTAREAVWGHADQVASNAQNNAQNWAYQNLIQGVRLSGRTVIADSGGRIDLPSGCVYTGMSGANYNPNIWGAYSAIQVLRNGQWVTIGTE